MKALGLVVSDKNIFENCILKTFFLTPWPTSATRTIWTILVGDHPGTIPVEFSQITISGSREDVVWTFPDIIQCKIVTPGAGSILTPNFVCNYKAQSFHIWYIASSRGPLPKLFKLCPWGQNWPSRIDHILQMLILSEIEHMLWKY